MSMNRRDNLKQEPVIETASRARYLSIVSAPGLLSTLCRYIPSQMTAAMSIRRSEAIAFLLPLSVPAEDALAAPTNRKHICKIDEFGKSVSRPTGSRRRRHLVAKLSFATFFLRRHLCFGWSRCTELQLPRKDDIAPFHFALHFDMRNATLLITDTSQTGIWISDMNARSEDLVFLHRSTRPLLRDTRVILGLDHRYIFCISVEKYMRNINSCKSMFEEYVQTMPRSLRAAAYAAKRRRSSCQPQKLNEVAGSYNMFEQKSTTDRGVWGRDIQSLHLFGGACREGGLRKRVDRRSSLP